MPARSDAALVADVIAGEVEAFAVLLQRYRDAYTRFAVRMLGSPEDADDALQFAFLRAFRALPKCAEPGRFGAWLYQIVVNECRTFATRRGRRERWFVRDPVTLEAVPARENPTGEHGLRQEIQYALDRLVAEQREAFILKHVEELSYEEMAEITGVGVSALKMRVKRACEQMRDMLEEAYHD
ncbi:MAG TPA: RNA polymerase sigma factor [Gemmatimonadales bacterium]